MQASGQYLPLSSSGMTAETRTACIKSLAASIGFDRVGVTAALPLQRAAYYRDWLTRGYAGEMGYLSQNIGLREDPSGLLDGARSIICTALNYYRRHDEPAVGASSEPSGSVARYAQGRDYHIVVRELLERLIRAMRDALADPFEARALVDTAPLIEREVAAAAGVGWIGKNTLVMHESLGSYVFLGEIITTLELACDAPATDHCGTCTRCLEACPTGAFPAPYQMDASRCISYLTIEKRGEIAPELAGKMGPWVYGCDICQEVCPHNSKAPQARTPAFLHTLIPPRVPLGPLIQLTSGGYRRLTRDSAARRATRAMWRRNAAIALSNDRASATAQD